MLETILSNLIASQQYAEFYREPDDETRFTLVRVLGQAKEWMLVATFDREGSYDGVRYIRKDLVLRIKERSAYIIARSEKAALVSESDFPLHEAVGTLAEMFTWCKKAEILINIDTPDLVFCGQVKDVGESWVSLEELDEDLVRFDGLLRIRQEDVTYIELDSLHLRRMTHLVFPLNGQPAT